MLKALFLLALLALPTGSTAESIYAVIVSASGDDEGGCGPNLSMDIESARAYHALIEGGIPADNIIVFMDERIQSNDACNPYPGHLYKDPERSFDFLPGLRVDYNETSFTKDNFLAVIQGDADGVQGGNGRVLESTENDRVFIFHTGHGDPGIFVWPNSDDLTKKELNDALKNMQEKKRFKELVYFVSTCYSGSMFNDTLEEDGPVYAFTDSNSAETSSFAGCHPFPDDPDRKYCIGSDFSFAWFENTDAQDLTKEKLSEQYEAMKPHIRSPAEQHGSLNIREEPAANFEGNADFKFNVPDVYNAGPSKCSIGIYQAMKLSAENNPKNAEFAQKLSDMEKERVQIKEIAKKVAFSVVQRPNFTLLNSIVNESPARVSNLDCHHFTYRAMEQNCKKVKKSPFVNDFVAAITNLCEAGYETASIVNEIENGCKEMN